MNGFDLWRLSVGGMTKDSDMEKNGAKSDRKRWPYVVLMLGIFFLVMLTYYLISLMIGSTG